MGMALTLKGMLEMPVLTRARGELLTGHGQLTREVRWVHTSEIYDIGTLLKGGEVLLTTGLGLVGAADAQLRRYVDDLADHAVTALIVEVGRTFPQVPSALLDQANERDLPVVALHGVIPFVEVTESVHRILIDEEVSHLRRAQEVADELIQVVLMGAGLQPLVDRITELAGCPARLVAADGRLVAEGRRGWSASGTTSAHVVMVHGTEWGQLEMDGEATVVLGAVARAATTAIALELVRETGRSTTGHARRQLLLDIAMNRFESAAELSSRSIGAGMTSAPGELLLAVCLGVEGRVITRAAVKAAAEAAQRTFGWSLVADLDNDLLVVGRTRTTLESALRGLLTDFADEVDRQLKATTGGRARAVTAGPPVADPPALVGAFVAAREISGLARRIGEHRRVLLTADLGVQRLLSRLVRDPELERFVDVQLGPLLEHDARTGQELVATLDAYFESGLSKTRTAEMLGIRRQSLYDRLARLEHLLGDFRQRDRRTALELALVAWRLRMTATSRS
jgi:PucR family transcriptional regulator, purine catabolism regulatory protein